MKRLAGLFFFVAMTTSMAFGQNKSNPDPTYSAGNYKHPNKAAYAKEHNLDKSTQLSTVEAVDNGNYKAQFKARKVKKVASIEAKSEPVGHSYKHPQGL